MSEDNKIKSKGLEFNIDVLRTDYSSMSIEELNGELQDIALIRSSIQQIKNILFEHLELLTATHKIKRIEAGEDPFHSKR